MSNDADIRILPYSMIVGQDHLKLALELAYIAPKISGVLISGQRGTGKSTVVRAFARMMDAEQRLPVTIPINATPDRVIGGWDMKELMLGKSKEQPGLIEEAHRRILYIDEVNLLEDYIINLILDVASTNVLEVQRDSLRKRHEIQFTLVGTMNPEEGHLRPQLLDRFGLFVDVDSSLDLPLRRQILQNVLDFDAAPTDSAANTRVNAAQKKDQNRKQQLEEARELMPLLTVPPSMQEKCVEIASAFSIEGYRADQTMLYAACAYAAREGQDQVTSDHLKRVARMALQHRRRSQALRDGFHWSTDDEQQLQAL